MKYQCPECSKCFNESEGSNIEYKGSIFICPFCKANLDLPDSTLNISGIVVWVLILVVFLSLWVYVRDHSPAFRRLVFVPVYTIILLQTTGIIGERFGFAQKLKLARKEIE